MLNRKLKLFLLLPILLLLTTIQTNAAPAVQHVEGEVETAGSYTSTEDFEGEREWSFDTYGPHTTLYDMKWEGNVLNFYHPGGYYRHIFMYIEFDNNGNMINWWSNVFGSSREFNTGSANANICEGDDDRCKRKTWGHLSITTPGEIKCNFTCAHRNVYDYTYRYEALRNSNWQVLDDQTARKCEDIRLQFDPDAEWFGELDHMCFIGGGTKLYTIDTPSPPTDFQVCGDQQTCLASATEYGLTDTTWGKGTQDIPEGWVVNTNNSMTGEDQYLECTNGICTPYSSGQYILSAASAATTYYGQCRGASVDEDIDGNTITTPEVTIDTGEAVIPETVSTLPFTVINQAPITTMSLSKNQIWPNEEVEVVCDVVDPDDCVDEIVKVKWNCYDTNGNINNCQLLNNGTWIDGGYIQEGNYGNPAQFTTKFRSPVRDTNYIVSCEAWDNDPRDPKSSKDNDQSTSEINVEVIPSDTKSCLVLTVSGEKIDIVCGESGESQFKAFPVGMKNPTYTWDCGNNTTCTDQNDPNCTCEYSTEGSYTPTLTMKDEGEVVNCTSQASARVTTQKSCKVEVRKGNDNYSNSITVSNNDKVEARLSTECTEGDTKWSIANGTILSSSNNKATATFDKGTGTLTATIGDTQCTAATVDATETVRWIP